jgi:hypothetical protein
MGMQKKEIIRRREKCEECWEERRDQAGAWMKRKMIWRGNNMK